MVHAGTADERYQNVSKFISLEGGKAYFIEVLMNEGGGGDNLAVAWTTEDPIANDALPISGDYLSPWVSGGVVGDPLVANGSFEADDVPAWPGYRAITDWIGGSGINDGGPFGDNGTIPDGAKLGFIQGSKTLSQNLIGLEAGTEYVLSFYCNARICCGGTIGFTESVGGEELGSVSDVKPVGGDNPYNSASYSFVAVGNEAELVFSAMAAGDATLLLDAVSVSKADGGDGPALSVVNNGDGTVTFEGKLQAAPTVNGPWEDVDGASPLTIPADQNQQFGRAVSE